MDLQEQGLAKPSTNQTYLNSKSSQLQQVFQSFGGEQIKLCVHRVGARDDPSGILRTASYDGASWSLCADVSVLFGVSSALANREPSRFQLFSHVSIRVVTGC